MVNDPTLLLRNSTKYALNVRYIKSHCPCVSWLDTQQNPIEKLFSGRFPELNAFILYPKASNAVTTQSILNILIPSL